MNSAVQHFYENDLARNLPKATLSTQIDKKQAEALFNRYQQQGEMDEDGIEKFFDEMGVESGTDIVAILISMHMGAKKMGCYEKSEFIDGCTSVGADSMDGWKKALPRLYKEL